MEFTILMPCLNEEQTLARCIDKAQKFLKHQQIEGEVLIADNGSEDNSTFIASNLGARVIHVSERGYGSALKAGILSARGEYIIMGDADDSYDFSKLSLFVDRLRSGYDLVMGNRFKGGIAPGAMPRLHKYIGNPVLSTIGRFLFSSKIRDFHCGLRGFSKQSVVDLRLTSPGMEFASEMVVKATLAELKICEIPTTLSKDGRNRPPHLNSWRDGWRHLRFLLLFSPNWLLLYPGIIIFLFSTFAFFRLDKQSILLSQIGFDINTQIVCAALIFGGFQLIQIALVLKYLGAALGVLPQKTVSVWTLKLLSFEKCLLASILGATISLSLLINALLTWKESGFGTLESMDVTRTVLKSMLCLIMSTSIFTTGVFVSSLAYFRKGRKDGSKD